MARYILDTTKPHKESLLGLINHDNATTVVEDLTLSEVNVTGLRQIALAENIARSTAATIVSITDKTDKVEVHFNQVNMNDIVVMSQDLGDFDWYTPDSWNDEKSPEAAIAAFKYAAERAGVASVAFDTPEVTRVFKEEENHYYLTFRFESYVFATGTTFKMPKHLSEVITVTALNGFIYLPIAAK